MFVAFAWMPSLMKKYSEIMTLLTFFVIGRHVAVKIEGWNVHT